MSDLELTAGAVLTIDLDAVVANYRHIQQQVGSAEVAGVVKADAYGLGAVPVSQALAEAGCRKFFVAHLQEALSLRPALAPDATLYVLNGLQPGAESIAAETGFTPVLNSLDQIDRWGAIARDLRRPLPAALQFDTGMSRLGLSPQEAAVLVASPDRLTGIDLRLIMSHLACADDLQAPSNPAQSEAFGTFAAQYPEVPRSLDNSGGAFLPRGHRDVVRAGIALYGGAPQIGRANPMRPVVTLEARIIQTRDVPAGVGVGYGLTSVADHPRRIATIAVGYADGWPRHLGDRGSAFIAGRRVPIAGRVSMDSITLDVTGVDPQHLRPGAPVELLGPHQTIDDVANDAGTISYEILTQLGRRYARRYQPAHAHAPVRSSKP